MTSFSKLFIFLKNFTCREAFLITMFLRPNNGTDLLYNKSIISDLPQAK